MKKKRALNIYEQRSRNNILMLIDMFCNGSQQEMANRTGINKASISQYVNGKNVPSCMTADKIAQVFDVNPAWVMGFDVTMTI